MALAYFLIYYSHKKQIFIDCHESDKPQRFHTAPTPRVGGLAIFLASVGFFSYYLGVVIGLAVSIAFLSGIIEDLKGNISQKMRLLIQALAATIFVVLGGHYLKTIGLGIEFPYIFAVVFTIFAIVGVVNSVNIIDGLNGLASGISITSLFVFFILALYLEDIAIATSCLAVLAATLGFFVFNFPKGKIFLGDGGAYYLGFVLATIAILIVSRHSGVSAWFCLAVVIYPIWEVVFSIYRRRKLSGKKATEPDKMHLHQVLMRSRKLSNPKAAIIIVASFLPFQLIAILVYNIGYIAFFLSLCFVAMYQYVYKIHSSTIKKTSVK